MAFSELGDSQGSFSYITPSSDLDIDDASLGKLLTEGTEDKPITAIQKACQSVNQSSLSVVFDRTGKLVGERNVDQSIGSGVTRNTYSAHSKFSENTQAEKVVDRSGKLEERDSSNAQIRTLLNEQRQNDYRRILRENWSSRTPSSSCRRRAPTPTRTIMATEIGFS